MGRILPGDKKLSGLVVRVLQIIFCSTFAGFDILRVFHVTWPSRVWGHMPVPYSSVTNLKERFTCGLEEGVNSMSRHDYWRGSLKMCQCYCTGSLFSLYYLWNILMRRDRLRGGGGELLRTARFLHPFQWAVLMSQNALRVGNVTPWGRVLLGENCRLSDHEIHRSPPLVFILSQMIPIHIIPSYFKDYTFIYT